MLISSNICNSLYTNIIILDSFTSSQVYIKFLCDLNTFKEIQNPT